MSTKLGRNQPCHCGSRQKYKRCCLEKDRMAQVKDLGARDEQGRLLGRPMIDTLWQGKRVRAVGSQIVFRPAHETKHEFFVNVLAQTLGNEWKQKQDTLEAAERHPVVKWVAEWDEMRRNQGEAALNKRDEGRGMYSSTATGNISSLIALAYDVYTLRHAMALSPEDAIVKRLGNLEQFQGVRYELAVAAIIVRAGYAIEWITDVSRKLPEFVARRGEVEIVVEAKSRLRPGVLGKPGERPAHEELKADLGRLLRDALEKETDGRPFVVFLDLNLPPRGEPTTEKWLKQLHDEVIEPRGEASAENPDLFSAVVFTNFSWHWDDAEPSRGAEHAIVIPFYPAVALPSGEADRIWEAVQQYGALPEG